MDAAVATSFALSVVRPFSCGLGGGGFMVIHRPAADGRPVLDTCINYRETAPAAVNAEYFEKLPPDASTRGGKACGVPGTVAGLLCALEHYGSLDRARVLAPAIRLARGGFTADAAYGEAAAAMAKNFDEHPEWKARYTFTFERFLGSGHIKVGDAIRLPEQAAVLEEIAERGRGMFYEGPVAMAIVDAVHAAGGEMTLEDLAGYRVVETEPLRIAFAGRTLLTMPPPSSGGLAMAQIAGLFERAKGPMYAAGPEANPAAYTHVLVECFKHAFADRAAWLGDPAFVEVPTARLTGGPYLDLLAKGIRLGRTGPPGVYGTRPDENGDPAPATDDGGTSHFCIIDSGGMAVSCTETINLHFGSLVSSPGLGFCLNNQMDDFTTRSGQANAFDLRQGDRNRPAPGKRPLSSMSPTIVLDRDGAVEAVAGGSGGPRIITATTQALFNALLRGDDAGRAVDRKRVHHQWKPDRLEIEPGFDERHNGLGVETWMTKMHHHVAESRPAEVACVQLILKKDGRWQAACDPRKGGAPAGE